MKVVVTDKMIHVEEPVPMPPNDQEWSCRKAANMSCIWAIRRLADELEANLERPGGGEIGLR